MQLRVARLCLDCEELHTENSCPVCASDRFAFLSTWLPVEERRRWRRPGASQSQPADNPVANALETVGRWFRRDAPRPSATTPLTRRSDHVPDLNFDQHLEPDTKPHSVEPHLSKRKA